MSDEPGAPIATIDALAAALVTRARPVVFRLADGEAELAAAQRLRGHAVVERGWASSGAVTTDGREVDAEDDVAAHVLAIAGGEIVGTCRLIVRVGAAPRAGRACVEIGRVVVVRRPWAVTAGLIGFSWLETRRRGYESVCGSVSAGVLRLYRRMGFLVRVVGPPVVTYGEARFPIVFEATATAAAHAAQRIDRGR